MRIGETIKSIGPAIIVAAVVLGPGSILASSRVGAEWGWLGLPVLAVAIALMIGMVALAARLGVVYKRSLCDELAARLGRGVAIAVGVVLFGIAALYQSSNNLAVGSGLEPLFASTSGELPSNWIAIQIAILIAANAVVIASLYLMRSLYSAVEKAMKVLILLMIVAFALNLLAAMFGEAPERNVAESGQRDWLPLIALIGTTFSVGGAFFQAYLVREKGWTLRDVKRGAVDSVIGISILGVVSAIIMVTSLLVFYRVSDAPKLSGMGDIARQLEPLFGSGAKYVFCGGFMAGALSSFMVNAAIGGTVLSDALGKGSKMEDRWARHYTTVALGFGMAVGIVGILSKESTVPLMLLAQALTVFGIPALGLALYYLATRKELTGEKKIPTILKVTALVGVSLAVILALRKGILLMEKLMG
jgi:manganese transport protein